MKITRKKTASLALDPRNARKHDQRSLDAIAASLAKFGQQKPIVISADGEVMAGNGTLQAAQQLGWEHIESTTSNLTGQEARAYAIADNRTAELSTWDEAVLAEQLAEWETTSGMVIGWDEGEMASLMAGLDDGVPKEAPEAKVDQAAELQKKWKVKRGDLWLIGGHRLLCGDSTSEEDVARLMDGEAFALMVTDPPYGVGYEGGQVNKDKRQKIKGDADTDVMRRFTGPALAAVPNGAWYIWHADIKSAGLHEAVQAAGFELRALIIWHKLRCSFAGANAHYLQKHEPCLYAVRGSAGFTGPSNEVTVWEYNQPRDSKLHPTQKPVEVMARAIGNHKGGVFDPFLGSGTTMVAAEQLKRRCNGLELEPKYCAVILERMQDMGLTPVLAE